METLTTIARRRVSWDAPCWGARGQPIRSKGIGDTPPETVPIPRGAAPSYSSYRRIVREVDRSLRGGVSRLCSCSISASRPASHDEIVNVDRVIGVFYPPPARRRSQPTSASTSLSTDRNRSAPSSTCHASSSEWWTCNLAGPLPRHLANGEGRARRAEARGCVSRGVRGGSGRRNDRAVPVRHETGVTVWRSPGC